MFSESLRLNVSASVLAFVASSSGRGFSVRYPSITIHAVSRSGSSPIVYLQLQNSSADADADEEVGKDEDLEMSELKIRPLDSSTGKSHIFRCYKILSQLTTSKWIS